MDYKQLALASGAVFVVMFVAGMIISLLSTQLQCSKIGATTSALQGLYSAFLPTTIYALATRFSMIRHPFSYTYERYWVSPDKSKFLGN